MKQIVFYLLLASSTAHAQGDVGLTLSTEIAKSNVLVLKAKSCTYDEVRRKNVCQTDITVVSKAGKKKPTVFLNDSTERITRYLIFNKAAQLVCDSAATGQYTQNFVYDSLGRILEISVHAGNEVHINTREYMNNDTVYCFMNDKDRMKKQLYFVIVQDKQHKPLQLYVPLRDGKIGLHSELKYDSNGYLVQETFFHIGSGRIWRGYKYKNDGKGLFSAVEVFSPTEENTTFSHYQ